MHILNECWIHNLVGVVLPKNSSLTAAFSEAVGRLIEAGLIKKWKQDEMDRVARKFTVKRIHVNEDIPLGLEHLQGSFYIWALLNGLALVAFVSEVAAVALRQRGAFGSGPKLD